MKTDAPRPPHISQRSHAALTTSEIVGMMVRRAWWLMAPALVLGTAGFFAARLWPVTYRSEAMVLVEQQKVPDRYVTPNVMADLQYRLDSMTQQILSRTRLQRMITKWALYPDERAAKPLDEIVETMREQIEIDAVRTPSPNRFHQNDMTAFRISFSYLSPALAQQVTNELTSLFIEESLRLREQLSVSTTEFLEAQVEQARNAVLEQEQKLREFRVRYMNELPDREGRGAAQAYGAIQAQLQAATSARERLEEQRVYLETLRAAYLRMSDVVPEETKAPNQLLITAKQALQDQQNAYLIARSKYTRNHPDVVRLERLMKDAEAMVEKAAAAAETGDAAGTAAKTPAARPQAPGIAEAESRLKSMDAEAAARQKDIDRLTRQLAEIQGSVRQAPVREQQLAAITREYENSLEHYHSLLKKKQESAVATNLETQQKGERFRLIDPASLPRTANAPTRLHIVAGGWVLGFLVGIAAALLRELVQDPIRSERDVASSTSAPVLARIPLMLSPGELHDRRLWRAAQAAFAAVVVVVTTGTIVQTYLAG